MKKLMVSFALNVVAVFATGAAVLDKACLSADIADFIRTAAGR